LIGLIMLLAAIMMTLSCAKQTKTIKESDLTPIEHKPIPVQTEVDFQDPVKCRVYYENWKDSENELEKCYDESDRMYYECE
jgi:hypothetical protein